MLSSALSSNLCDPQVQFPVPLPPIAHTFEIRELNSMAHEVFSTLAFPAVVCHVDLESKQTTFTRHIACDFIE